MQILDTILRNDNSAALERFQETGVVLCNTVSMGESISDVTIAFSTL